MDIHYLNMPTKVVIQSFKPRCCHWNCPHISSYVAGHCDLFDVDLGWDGDNDLLRCDDCCEKTSKVKR